MIKKLIFLIFGSIGLSFAALEPADAKQLTHPVQPGETIYTLSQRYGVPEAAIMKVNDLSDSAIEAGETLTIPAAVSAAERELLAKLVSAEAKGEPYAGKVAVATVVLNRVDNENYPDTVHDVIYEVTPSGHYAFSPVLDGAINNKPDDESRRAVTEALAFRGQGQQSLYFYNPKTATSGWVATREQTLVIGDHIFAK
ncbi:MULTISPECIES: cell wall hydrolase [Shouchella]|uniref:cell wall hydrolase n=1 Tax=Shouchella TaxID=2893057 RepID=UPI0007879F88|nr:MULTISPECIES: cell wall hydrolase [Shouchella]PAD90138.1 peptidoglycan-binding protein [Shouchella clausii]GIN11520.1 hypothetical protein J26TS2_13870 [Shouchella clausii]